MLQGMFSVLRPQKQTGNASSSGGIVRQTPPHLDLEETEISSIRYRWAIHLKTVTFAPGTKKIAYDAFRDSGLAEIILPDSVRTVERGAFANCRSLSSVVWGAGTERIPSECFRVCVSLRRVVLPATLKAISYHAFCGCTALEEIELPPSLRIVAAYAFEGCTNLKRIVLPEGVTELGEGVFRGCRKLRQVVLPVSMQTVSPYAFSGCDSLQSVIHPHVDQFQHAFWCTPFWKIRYPDREPPLRLPLELTGTHMGEWLREQGYDFFKPGREYSIRLPDANGVVEVSSWCGDDGPDEDGYGREEYYDWWLLDEALRPIPGIRMFHSYSRLDMRNHEKQWEQLKQQAAKIVKSRR